MMVDVIGLDFDFDTRELVRIKVDLFDNPVWFSIHEAFLIRQTCLKDKDLKEVWEGDIFGHRTLEDGKMNVIEGEVTWNDRLAQWEVAEGLMIWALRKDAEVIGNIYENPKLLET